MKAKYILLCAAVAGGLFFPSCSDFLEEERNPNALSPDLFWQSEEDIMKGLTSVYAALQPNIDWAVPYERYIVIDNYRSDEVTFRDDVTSWMDIASFTNESTNGVTVGEWQNLYKGINYANQCIDNIPNVPEENEEVNHGKFIKREVKDPVSLLVYPVNVYGLFQSACNRWKNKIGYDHRIGRSNGS